METLKLGAAVTTREPQVTLETRLVAGTYRVELVVQGQRAVSAPATLLLKVIDPTR